MVCVRRRRQRFVLYVWYGTRRLLSSSLLLLLLLLLCMFLLCSLAQSAVDDWLTVGSVLLLPPPPSCCFSAAADVVIVICFRSLSTTNSYSFVTFRIVSLYFLSPGSRQERRKCPRLPLALASSRYWRISVFPLMQSTHTHKHWLTVENTFLAQRVNFQSLHTLCVLVLTLG